MNQAAQALRDLGDNDHHEAMTRSFASIAELIEAKASQIEAQLSERIGSLEEEWTDPQEVPKLHLATTRDLIDELQRRHRQYEMQDECGVDPEEEEE